MNLVIKLIAFNTLPEGNVKTTTVINALSELFNRSTIENNIITGNN